MQENVLLEMDVSEGFTDFGFNIITAMEDAEREIESLDITIESIKLIKPECDKLDYTIAACSGILCGILDSFLVGEFDLKRGRNIATDKVNKFVEKAAKLLGCKKEGLSSAVEYLEKKFPIPSDGNTTDFGGGLQHHLRDFAHHPTIVGLFFSLLTQFTYKAYGTDKTGRFIIVDVPENSRKFVGKGILDKIIKGTIVWFFHLVSDMAGCNSSAGLSGGTGIPGPVLAFAKEISALPFFRNTKTGNNPISVFLSKLFNGTLLAQHDEEGRIIKGTELRFDLRGELGVAIELGRQSLPVITNECIVRAFFFVRRLIIEIGAIESNGVSIDWDKIKPYGNPTVKRMITVAHGTFCLIDVGDATIRGFAKGGGTFNPCEFFLRLNIIGIGRFTISLYGEVRRGIEIIRKENEIVFSKRERIIVKDYIEGLKMLSYIYDDAELVNFIDDFEKSDIYKQAFEKTVELATKRGVPEASILKDKNDIDNYFMGG